jgi:hypothetical protein
MTHTHHGVNLTEGDDLAGYGGEWDRRIAYDENV